MARVCCNKGLFGYKSLIGASALTTVSTLTSDGGFCQSEFGSGENADTVLNMLFSCRVLWD